MRVGSQFHPPSLRHHASALVRVSPLVRIPTATPCTPSVPHLVRTLGIEPRHTGSKPVALTITLCPHMGGLRLTANRTSPYLRFHSVRRYFFQSCARLTPSRFFLLLWAWESFALRPAGASGRGRTCILSILPVLPLNYRSIWAVVGLFRPTVVILCEVFRKRSHHSGATRPLVLDRY